MKKINKLRVLAYHKVENADQFEKQIIYLKNKYHILNMQEFERYREDHGLYKNPLLLTFDDGDISMYQNALPILKNYNVHAIIFVVSELIDTKIPFWWDEIKYYLGEVEGEKKVWEVKKWHNKDRVNWLKDLRLNSDKVPFETEQLSTAQLKEMSLNGLSIANHSHTHPIYDKCTIQELQFECEHSINMLLKNDFYPFVFAYPNGDFSEESEAILKSKCFTSVFLFNHNINSGLLNPLRISRLIVNDSTTISKLKFILSGYHSRILPIIKLLFRIIKK